MFDKEKNKINVSGGSGFVGSNTIKELNRLGYKVFNFDLKEGYDIRKPEQLRAVIKKNDKVLHLAAIARFAQADEDPYLAYETNVIGTMNVATVCEENEAERLVYSSTGSVYMPIEKDPPVTEDFKARGNSVYACSKFVGEECVRRVKTPGIILRYAHLYGEGKIGHGAIGGFIERMKRGLAPILYGGKQSNDFCYIKDVVQANILALQVENPEAMNQVYNVGTGEELTTIKVFELLREFFKYDKEFEMIESRTVDPLRFVCDISKIKRLLGYEPKFNFLQGMQDWINENPNIGIVGVSG